MNKLIDCFLSTDFDDNASVMNNYDVITVSYFDHYLSKEEYSKIELVCYSDIKDDNDKAKLFQKIENKFIKLYELLYSLSNEKVTICIDGHLHQSKSYEEYKLFVMNAIKENPLCQILYPSLMMFSVTGYDLTHQFFFLKDNKKLASSKNRLKNIVGDFGLHII